MEIVYDILLNAGPLGVLAIYAIYTQREGQKRLDTLQGEFMERVEQINQKGLAEREALLHKMEDREREIIERWRSVVEKVESERDEAQKETQKSVEKLLTKINQLLNRSNDK